MMIPATGRNLNLNCCLLSQEHFHKFFPITPLSEPTIIASAPRHDKLKITNCEIVEFGSKSRDAS
jgi:hypothetical protein